MQTNYIQTSLQIAENKSILISFYDVDYEGFGGYGDHHILIDNMQRGENQNEVYIHLLNDCDLKKYYELIEAFKTNNINNIINAMGESNYEQLELQDDVNKLINYIK